MPSTILLKLFVLFVFIMMCGTILEIGYLRPDNSCTPATQPSMDSPLSIDMFVTTQPSWDIPLEKTPTTQPSKTLEERMDDLEIKMLLRGFEMDLMEELMKDLLTKPDPVFRPNPLLWI